MNFKDFKQYASDCMDYIRHCANPANVSAEKGSQAIQERSRVISDETQRHPNGIFIPDDILSFDYGRAMNSEEGAKGGYLVENEVSKSFIGSLHNSMLIIKLGAIMLRNLVGDLSIPKISSGATAHWLGEGQNITESDVSLAQANMRPKSVGCYVDLTRKFIKQSSLDVFMFLMSDLALRLALAIDLASIAGTGASNQPLGILNTTGIGSVTLNAANTPDWDDIVDLETAVATDNALEGNLAYITNSTIGGNLKKTQKVSGYPTYLLENGMLNNYRCHVTNQVPSKHIIFGNWRDVIIGEWSGIDVNVDTATLSASGGIRLVCIKDVDVAIRHPESFADGYKA